MAVTGKWLHRADDDVVAFAAETKSFPFFSLFCAVAKRES